MAHHKDARKITVVQWEQTTCLWPNEHLLLGHDLDFVNKKDTKCKMLSICSRRCFSCRLRLFMKKKASLPLIYQLECDLLFAALKNF